MRAQFVNLLSTSETIIAKQSALKCCCGKVCKGERGLKMHQRSCRLVHDLDTEMQQDIDEQNDLELTNIKETDQCTNENFTAADCNEIPVLKRGIRDPGYEVGVYDCQRAILNGKRPTIISNFLCSQSQHKI